MQWPLQSECDEFYGNPRGSSGRPSSSWEKASLVWLPLPFVMTFAGAPVKQIRVHRKCRDSLGRVLASLWDLAGKDQATVEQWGINRYDGCYNFRNVRGGTRLSMHAYACAIDLDADRNGLGNANPRFKDFPWVIDAFEKEGWVWGGNWSRPDGMHFQAARVG